LDNVAVARVLREIADLLEIKDDNPFKIRAYRNGADIIANHPHEVATLDIIGLREIPGIGKDLAARIREIESARSPKQETRTSIAS
jgi:DNA polymerase (family 10)